MRHTRSAWPRKRAGGAAGWRALPHGAISRVRRRRRRRQSAMPRAWNHQVFRGWNRQSRAEWSGAGQAREGRRVPLWQIDSAAGLRNLAKFRIRVAPRDAASRAEGEKGQGRKLAPNALGPDFFHNSSLLNEHHQIVFNHLRLHHFLLIIAIIEAAINVNLQPQTSNDERMPLE
jgi:hypothetical protein